MIKKLIIVDTSDSAPKTFENVQATTLGELKEELSEVSFSNKTVTERSTRASLELDSSKLPNSDEVILFLSAKNIKGGSDSEPILLIKELSEQMRSLMEITTDLTIACTKLEARSQNNADDGCLKKLQAEAQELLREFQSKS